METYRVYSHEVRWFFDRPLAATDAETWFFDRVRLGDNGRPYPLQWPAGEWRSDWYIVFPAGENMGIKWRDEKDKEPEFQIKGRLAVLGEQRFSKQVAGISEHWVKWSYKGEESKRRFQQMFIRQDGSTADGVVQVDKCRVLRKVRFDLFGKEVEVPAKGKESRIDRGANMELTRIRVNGSREENHWSLAVEAFPNDSEIHEAFTRTVSSFLDGFPTALAAVNSMSYPEWLQQFGTR